MENGRRLSPWIWVPSLYFAEGIPNSVVSDASKVMYTDLGLSVEMLGVVTGSMYLAWVIKPLWSPLVDLVKSKRWWIVLTEFLLACAFLGLSLTTKSANWLALTQVCFWLLALVSATQDIAADGFYMLALEESDQAGFTGIRSTAYRLSMLFSKGVLVWLAGYFAASSNKFGGWSSMFLVPGTFYLLAAAYHFVVLPRPTADQARESVSMGEFLKGYAYTFASFFRRSGVARAIVFILLFRVAEVQVLGQVAPFLKGPLENGGLGLTTQQFGLAYGTFGVIGIICGGILAGKLVARFGLRTWYWAMIFIMHLPNLAFLYLALSQNTNVNVISTCLFIEQFGYGFGFTVFMLYLMYFTRGELQTSHYAIATGFMAMGVMLPQMGAGFVAKALGFKQYFGYIAVCTLPSFAVAYMAWKDEGFLAYFEPKKAEAAAGDVGISPE
ncbi:MFS transporter [bacterium]|nr:MFS transporter [bacterium]